MKLRDLVSGSLPRVIGRRKKQQQQQEQWTPTRPPLQTARQQEHPWWLPEENPDQHPHPQQPAPWCTSLPTPLPPHPGLDNLQDAAPCCSTKGLHQSFCYDDNQNHCPPGPPSLQTWGVGGDGGDVGCGCQWGVAEEEAGCPWEGQDLVSGALHLYGTLNIRVAARPPHACICLCCRRVLSCQGEASWDSWDRRDTAALRQEEERGVCKTRSRIRTNPWLPCPRPPAPDFRCMGVGCLPPPAPLLPGPAPSQAIYSLAAIPRSPSSSSPSPPPSCSDNSLSEFAPPDQTSSCDVTASDCAMETDRSSGRTESDVTSTSRSTSEGRSDGRPVLGNLNDLNRGAPVDSWDTDTSTDASPIVECCVQELGAPELNVSFQYEEALDSTLERAWEQRGSNLSLQDLLREETTRDAAVQTDFDSSEESDWVGDGGETISSEDGTSDFPCSDSAAAAGWRQDCMQDSVDTGYFSLPRSATAEVEEDLQACGEQQWAPQPPPSFSDLAASLPGQSQSKTWRPQTHGRLPPGGERQTQDGQTGSGRSLAEVRLSLQEKLGVLGGHRERRLMGESGLWGERGLVGERGLLGERGLWGERGLQEGEWLREEQKRDRLQRKQVLLETLRGLRARLENQGDRLQSSYSAVLSLQQRFVQSGPPLAVLTASTT